LDEVLAEIRSLSGSKTLIKKRNDEIRTEFYRETCFEAFALIDDEVEKVIDPEWRDLKEINGGFVAVHTMLVCYRMIQDPLFAEFNSREQNILKWAALLHDIRKLGMPVYHGKDHIHPFKSAESVLEIFERLGYIKLVSEEDKDDFKNVLRLLRESV
jgi:hypothetical protein